MKHCVVTVSQSTVSQSTILQITISQITILQITVSQITASQITVSRQSELVYYCSHIINNLSSQRNVWHIHTKNVENLQGSLHNKM